MEPIARLQGPRRGRRAIDTKLDGTVVQPPCSYLLLSQPSRLISMGRRLRRWCSYCPSTNGARRDFWIKDTEDSSSSTYAGSARTRISNGFVKEDEFTNFF